MTGEMGAFFVYSPYVAKEETRVVVVDKGSNRAIAPGYYSFLGPYCLENNCDCRNVMINVYECFRGHLATINHALDPGGFKDVGLPRAFLEPFNKQTKEVEALLKLFKEQLRDNAFAHQLERHYKMVKEKVARGKPRASFLRLLLTILGM